MIIQSVAVVGRMRLRMLRLTLFCLCALSGCVTEPITGRKHFDVIPEGTANSMGVQAYQQLLTEAKLSTDPRQNDLLQRVGRRISMVTDNRMASEGRPLYQWEFKVIDNPKTVNAFALPGGKVAFYSGIFPITQNEAGIAVVMGHEVGHAYAQHGRARMSQEVVAKFGFSAIELFLGGDRASDSSKLAIAALGLGYQVGVELPFSRGDESAADEIGLTLMAEAGYDPRDGVAFWERMEAASGGQGPPEFLSTHPSHASRIQRIKQLLPRAILTYEKSRGNPAVTK